MWPAAVVLVGLVCIPEMAMAQRSPKPGPTTVPAPGSTPQTTTGQQKRSFSVAQLNQLHPPVSPKVTQAKLQAAMNALKISVASLEFAAGRMSSYFNAEAVCAERPFTTKEMDEVCLPQDSLQACKEKLVAACASGPLGPGLDKKDLWLKVQTCAADLGKKAKAVNDLESIVPASVGGNKVVPLIP